MTIAAATLLPACSRSEANAVADRQLPDSTCPAFAHLEPSACFELLVPENEAHPGGRSIGIRVVVLPAVGPRAKLEPVVLLQGGPGVPGTGMAVSFSRRRELREQHDLIFVDQRGTAPSHRLSCEFLGRYNFLGVLFPRDHLRDCRARLATMADLSLYTSRASAADLEVVRQSLGIQTWSLLGFSFGTRLAQSYAKRYPDRVRSVILDGVVPYDVGLTADLAESMKASLAFVTGLCDRDPGCGRRYPDTKGTLAALAARLDSAPVAVSVTDSLGRMLSGPFGRWDFAYAVRGMLYGPLAAAIPAWVHHAQRTGDFSAFARVYWQRTRWVGDSSSVPLHLGVYCSEDLPFIDSLDVLRRSQGTLIGARYYEEYRAGCAEWPMPRVAAELREPWSSAIPTLLISGERDPVTPPSYADRVGKSLSQHVHIVIPGGGHAEPSSCKSSVMATFLSEGIARVAAGTCLAQLRFPAWVEP